MLAINRQAPRRPTYKGRGAPPPECGRKAFLGFNCGSIAATIRQQSGEFRFDVLGSEMWSKVLEIMEMIYL